MSNTQAAFTVAVKEEMAEVIIYHRVDAGDFDVEAGRSVPAVVEAYRYFIGTDMLSEDSPHRNCFRMNNCVDGTEINVQNQKRSLSVGDLVKIKAPISGGLQLPVIWQVKGCGWETVGSAYLSDARRAGVEGHPDGRPNTWQSDPAIGELYGNLLGRDAVN